MKVGHSIGLSIILVISFILFFSHAAASGLDSFKGMEGQIYISGGTAHLPMMHRLKQKIEKFNPQIHIFVRGGGSSLGIEQVGKGNVNIGNAGRPLMPKEKAAYNLEAIPFAIDGIAIVTHPSNPVSNLDSNTARKIFYGEITNWKEVGGHDKKISLYDRNVGSGTRKIFITKLLLKKEPAATAQIVNSHDNMKVVVSWDKNAIGYMSIGYIDPKKVKPLPLDGIAPTQSNAQTGMYSVARKLYMYIPAEKAKVSVLVRKFIDYILCPEGKDIIKGAGFIPL
jgi:phosphate transport system substrate-binding protein